MGLRYCVTGLAVTLAAAFSVLSCGGTVAGGGGSTSVVGTIGGVSVSTKDTVAIIEPSGSNVLAGVAITNIPDTCGVLQREFLAGGPEPANTEALSLSVTFAGTAVPAGTYAIGDQQAAQVSAIHSTTDSNCMSRASTVASSGSITYAVVSATTIQGSFDLVFGSEHVTGRFAAPVCNANFSGARVMPVCGH
jgi:hypothetical protein